MPYIGKQPEHGRFAKVDQINSGFDGSAVTFNLTVDSVAVYPTNPQNLLISIGGVIQQPGTDYTVSAATITLTSAPAASTDFFGVLLGDVLDIGTPSDGSVTVSKMAVNSVDSDQYVDGSIDLVHMSANSVDSNQYVDGSIETVHIDALQITGAKIAANTVTGDKIAMGSDARGDVLIYDGTNYVRLGADDGKFLRSNGTGSNPSWETAGGSRTVSPTNVDNAIITFVDSGDTFTAEANLIFTGTNLGIGVSDPDQFLEVKGGNNAFININHTGSAGGYQSGIYFKASDVNCYKIDVTGNGDMSFRQGASETVQLALDAAGKLGVGVAEPEFQLHIKNGGTDSGASFHARNSLVIEKSAETGIAIGTRNSDSGFLDFAAPQSSYDGRIQYVQSARYMNLYAGAAVKFKIYSNGDIHDDGGEIHPNSDERIKENVVDSTYGLAELLQLRPVDFNYCSWYTNGGVNNLKTGLIAQEVKEFLPHIIKIRANEVAFDFTDPDGTPHHLHDPIPDMHLINDNQLLSVVIKAIQELNAKIDALKDN